MKGGFIFWDKTAVKGILSLLKWIRWPQLWVILEERKLSGVRSPGEVAPVAKVCPLKKVADELLGVKETEAGGLGSRSVQLLQRLLTS